MHPNVQYVLSSPLRYIHISSQRMAVVKGLNYGNVQTRGLMHSGPQLSCCQYETSETQADAIFPLIDVFKLGLEAYICVKKASPGGHPTWLTW